MDDAPFTIKVVPQEHNEYALVLTQKPFGKTPGFQITLERDHLQVMLGEVMRNLTLLGYARKDLHRNRTEPFLLDEPEGVYLCLLAEVTNSPEFLQQIWGIRETLLIEQLKGMCTEEQYYWFAKVTTNPRGAEALRILILPPD